MARNWGTRVGSAGSSEPGVGWGRGCGGTPSSPFPCPCSSSPSEASAADPAEPPHRVHCPAGASLHASEVDVAGFGRHHRSLRRTSTAQSRFSDSRQAPQGASRGGAPTTTKDACSSCFQAVLWNERRGRSKVRTVWLTSIVQGLVDEDDDRLVQVRRSNGRPRLKAANPRPWCMATY